MRSRLKRMKKVARSLREYQRLILNGFVASKEYNARIMEGLNTPVKLRVRKAFGLRIFDATEVLLYHQLGGLPDPLIDHRF